MLKITLALLIHMEIINRYFLRMWGKNGLVLYTSSFGSQEAEEGGICIWGQAGYIIGLYCFPFEEIHSKFNTILWRVWFLAILSRIPFPGFNRQYIRSQGIKQVGSQDSLAKDNVCFENFLILSEFSTLTNGPE